MSVNLRFPNITAKTEREQLQQIQSYMYQLVEQLNWALENIDGIGNNTSTMVQTLSAETTNGDDAQSTFNSIKALIIKSADIVNAYYEQMNTRFEGEYVAQSDFGEFSEQTANDIKANSTAIEQFYTNMQQIVSDIAEIEQSIIEANAYIKSGLLYYDDSGVPIYGLEIGQRSEIDGEEVFNKYARFTSGKLSFYDSNDNEVAYFSDKKLYITHVEVTGSYAIGSLMDYVLSDTSVVTKYIEIGGGS